MATIKSYTDIEQSKKLAEILPLETADMYYGYGKDKPEFLPISDADVKCLSQPCWSLAALFGVLPLVDFTTPQLIGTPKTLYRCIYNDNLKSHAYDNPVDACVAMVEKLHELNLEEDTPTNGDIIDYVDAHIQELIDTAQNKPWSEEDEKRLDNAITQLKAASNIIVDDEVDDSIAFIKSLKDRVQPL